MTAVDEPITHNATGHWPAVYAIALGAFALVVTEFLPVGVLPEMSRSLSVSEGTGGLAVTATALLGAVAAPLAALVIRRLDRRKVLLELTGLLILSSVLSVFASNFGVLLGARGLLGVSIGGFWAVALAAVERLVPQDRVHTASALVLGGISVGSVVSVPAGSFVATHADWRLAFVAGGLLGALVLVIQLILLPSIPAHRAVSIGHFFGLFAAPKIVAILLTVVLIVGGHYVGYTFINPYLHQVTGAGPTAVTVLLFGYGVLTVAGNFVGGAAAGRKVHGTVLGTALVFAVALGLMSVFATHLAVVVVALVLWSLALGAAPVATQLWLFAAARQRHSIEAAQAMNTSVFQLSIGLGSFAGSVVVNSAGLRSSVGIGAGILLLSVVTVLLVGALDRRTASAHR